jgi:hypothetical protein
LKHGAHSAQSPATTRQSRAIPRLVEPAGLDAKIGIDLAYLALKRGQHGIHFVDPLLGPIQKKECWSMLALARPFDAF